MAKGLRIGVRLKAKATKILGGQGATQEFGKQASKVEMRGEIGRKEGAGPTTQWVVRWDKPLSESAWKRAASLATTITKLLKLLQEHGVPHSE